MTSHRIHSAPALGIDAEIYTDTGPELENLVLLLDS